MKADSRSMPADRIRLLAWAACLNDGAALSMLAAAAVPLGMADEARDPLLHYASPNAIVVSHGLGFVGIPTIVASPSDQYPVAASGAILPRDWD
jgi:hypothetical protein